MISFAKFFFVSADKNVLSCETCKTVIRAIDNYLTQVGTEQGVILLLMFHVGIVSLDMT